MLPDLYLKRVSAKQRVSLRSGFFEHVSTPDLDQVTIGYSPPLSLSPMDTKVIAAKIRKTEDIMKKL